VAVDHSGNVYLGDRNAIRKVGPGGDVTTIAGVVGQGGTADGAGTAARFHDTLHIVVDAQANVFAADYLNRTIRKITPDGVVSTIAGSPGTIDPLIDGPIETARFRSPAQLAIDSAGSLFVADTNKLRKISNGTVTTVNAVVPVDVIHQLAADAAGNLYVVDTIRQRILKGVPELATDFDTRLVNLSIRATVRSQQPLVVGFTLSGSRPLLLRGIGPGLEPFISTGGLATNPQLEVFDATGVLVGSNDDWGGEKELISAFAAAGAFPLSSGSTDAALVRTVSGASSMHFVASANGVGLIELFDLGMRGAPGVTNLSARHRIGTSSDDTALVAGFTIDGPAEKTVLVRGIGPGLGAAPFNITGALADPTLTLFNARGEAFAINNDWPSILGEVFVRSGAFPLAAGTKDAALLLTLAPGVYSAALSAADGGTGDALIEIYEVR
jgi:hypothetical protein